MQRAVARVEAAEPEQVGAAWQALMKVRAGWQDMPNMEENAIDSEARRPVDKVRSHQKKEDKDGAEKPRSPCLMVVRGGSPSGAGEQA